MQIRQTISLSRLSQLPILSKFFYYLLFLIKNIVVLLKILLLLFTER